jgi:uncharacterized protein YcgL (UPF0745 family)
MTAKPILLNWIAEDDLKKVFQGLLFLAKKHEDEQILNNATFQSGRLKALDKEKINDTISHEEYYLQSAKIRQALLQIIQELPENWTLAGAKDISSTLFISSKEQPFNSEQPNQIISTAGDKSPVVITTGDVTINYEDMSTTKY